MLVVCNKSIEDDRAIFKSEVGGGGKMKCELLSVLSRIRDKTDKGVLYNVHYPINPEGMKEKGCDYVAALRKVNQSYEY